MGGRLPQALGDDAEELQPTQESVLQGLPDLEYIDVAQVRHWNTFFLRGGGVVCVSLDLWFLCPLVVFSLVQDEKMNEVEALLKDDPASFCNWEQGWMDKPTSSSSHICQVENSSVRTSIYNRIQFKT